MEVIARMMNKIFYVEVLLVLAHLPVLVNTITKDLPDVRNSYIEPTESGHGAEDQVKNPHLEEKRKLEMYKLNEIQRQREDKHVLTSNEQLQRVKGNTHRTQQIEDNAVKLIAVVKRILNESSLDINELYENSDLVSKWSKDVCPKSEKITCDPKAAYRTMDGSCNNLRNPEWGMSFTAQQRYLPPAYDNDLDSPRTTSYSGQALPSPRAVSNELFRNDKMAAFDKKRTVMVMAWGQFLAHDLILTPTSQGRNETPIECCEMKNRDRAECFPITLPDDDPHFRVRCMNFVRSSPAIDSCIPRHREQLNRLTSFIDASTVYGSTDEEAHALRTFQGGELKTSLNGKFPPSDDNSTCVLRNSKRDFCLKCGDLRANVVPSLGLLHVLFMREHNRLARQLRKLNGHWGDEKIFQESRKIVAAFVQHITYNEWLPKVLSRSARLKYHLDIRGRSKYRYNPHVNPTIRNAIGAAVLRFGHSMIAPQQTYVKDDYFTVKKTVKLEKTFHNPHMLIKRRGKYLPYLARWMTSKPQAKIDRFFEKSVRDLLFEDSEGHSFDLTSFNLQRGRDHGIPSYTAWRRFCKLPWKMEEKRSFDNLPDHSKTKRKILKRIYSHVDDIDLFAGGMSERPIGRSAVGPTFSCLLGKQLQALRTGDRFWYENIEETGFKKEQLAEIKKITLANIMCRNIKMDLVNRDVFRALESNATCVHCQSMPALDISKWKE